MDNHPDEPLLAYVTLPSPDQALKIGQVLVEERLAACIHLLPGLTSIYRWQGVLETAQEVLLLAKTQESLRAPLIERIRSLHSYQIPCIVFLPIEGGYLPYLDWLKTELRG